MIDDPSNPVRVLEITTNSPSAAAAIEGRMRAVGVRGYGRIEPHLP